MTEQGQAELGVEGAGMKGKLTLPAKYFCVLLLTVIAGGLTGIIMMLHEHDRTSIKLAQAVSDLSGSINLMVCISALPTEERQSEYRNPASNCNFFSKRHP